MVADDLGALLSAAERPCRRRYWAHELRYGGRSAVLAAARTCCVRAWSRGPPEISQPGAPDGNVVIAKILGDYMNAAPRSGAGDAGGAVLHARTAGRRRPG